jgi:TPR repeat protein
MKTRRFLVVVLLLFASAAPLWGDDLAPSVDAIRERAAQGDAAAQFNVGFLYAQGNGVPQDEVEAYKWFTLAAASYTDKQFRDGAVQARDRVAARMTPALIAEAQKLAREWKKQ